MSSTRDLRIEEVATRLGVGIRTVYTLIENGQAPPSYKVGGRRYFPADRFEQWLDEQRVGAR